MYLQVRLLSDSAVPIVGREPDLQTPIRFRDQTSKKDAERIEREQSDTYSLNTLPPDCRLESLDAVSGFQGWPLRQGCRSLSSVRFYFAPFFIQRPAAAFACARISAANVTAAVSVLRIESGHEMNSAPWCFSISTSSSVRPPSGPITNTVSR